MASVLAEIEADGREAGPKGMVPERPLRPMALRILNGECRW